LTFRDQRPLITLVFSIVITEKGGAQRQLDIESPEVSIGRLEDNDICLPKSNVSKHHARLVFKDDRYVLLDQKSTNGTYVNGRRISAPMVVRKGDKIYIGDFILTLAAPGGTFENVSAREFRPRRPVSDPVLVGPTDPPRGMTPTRDEMRRPSGLPDSGVPGPSPPNSVAFGDSMLPGVVAPGASVPVVIGPGALPAGSLPPEAGSAPASAVSAAPPSLPPTVSARVSAMPPLPAHRPIVTTALGSRGSSVPPPVPSSVAVRVTVPPPPKAATARITDGNGGPRVSAEVTRADDVPAGSVVQPQPAFELDARARGAAVSAPPGDGARGAASAPPRPSAPLSASDASVSQLPSSTASEEAAPARASKGMPSWMSADSNPLTSGLTSPAVLAPSLRLQGALAMLMERLATEMNIAQPEESAFPSEHLTTIEHLMDELASEGSIGPDLDRRFLREAAIAEAVGLGPLDRLLANRSVREVVVDGPTRILADLGGGLSPVSSFFSDDSAVLVVAQRLLHRAGRKLDDNTAVQEARLPSGGFMQLLLPPLSAKGPLVTVRCPPRAQSSPESQVTEGVLSTEMLAFLRAAVHQRKNILVLGAMGSGVSTLLGMLTMLTPDHERVVTIENAPSGSLLNARTLPLSRHARPELTLEEFLRYASRLRHDRLVIDDVSGADALAALSAAAASPGVILGMHAPTPQTALLQLDLFAQAAIGGGRTSLAPLLASALNVLVHVAATSEGTRRIQSISELKSGKDKALELTTLFRLEAKSFVRVGAAEPKA
jgi:pilus assembly protein CpaF